MAPAEITPAARAQVRAWAPALDGLVAAWLTALHRDPDTLPPMAELRVLDLLAWTAAQTRPPAADEEAEDA